MEYTQLARQVVDFQKHAFENWYKACCDVQDQTHSSVNSLLNQSQWMPKSQGMDGWIKVLDDERKRFKHYVDSYFNGLDQLLNDSDATISKTKKKAGA
jgi:hypothetical protein